jgi:hypothetical protein
MENLRNAVTFSLFKLTMATSITGHAIETTIAGTKPRGVCALRHLPVACARWNSRAESLLREL